MIDMVLIIAQILFILVLIFLIFTIVKQVQILKLEKRFDSFSLLSKTIDEISFFDQFSLFIHKGILAVSKTLKKSHFLIKYAEKYEKYISFEEKGTKEGMDYVSSKFFIVFFFIFLYFLAFLIHHKDFSFMTFFITIFLSFYLLDVLLVIKFHQKRKKVEEDLLKAIIIMNNSFKAGRNIIQAIITVKNELDGPIADEFKKIYLDMTYGLSLDVVFNRFYDRVKLEDAKYIASSLTLLSKTGGNIVRVFNSIENSFYNKKKLNNEMKSLTSASLFVFRVLVALPFVFTFIIYVLNPTYFNPLFEHPLGIALLLIIISLFILYVMVIKKVLKVNME